MTRQRGRDFLIKIGDGADPEAFVTLAAARVVAVAVSNAPVDTTSLDAEGVQSFSAAAGLQKMQLSVEGLFQNFAAEEMLRAAAFSGTANRYQLGFPNGDVYTAAFIVQDYKRSGPVDGLETFAATFVRSGTGVFVDAT